MSALIIDGKKIADAIRAEVKTEAEKLLNQKGIKPGLAFIIVGDNPASVSYINSKGKACNEVGFHSTTLRLPADTSEETLIRHIKEFNNDSSFHGILVQLPLPKHLNEQHIIEAIDSHKDVDGLHPVNIGKLVLGEETFVPCTPAGILELLIRSGNPPAGKHVVVVGRSNIVGKPIANLLLQKGKNSNAVVTIVHTGATDIASYTKTADILIAAIGKPKFITANLLKEGVVVIDVGINRVPDSTAKSGSRLVGDVDFDSVKEIARAITPVPGGVGPMTIAMLLKNTLKAAKNQ
jgi:methylenetetrahydrofolate dehydrogenase (NADP+)/methenyltetrahydrofolate cyclohydrolase